MSEDTTAPTAIFNGGPLDGREDIAVRRDTLRGVERELFTAAAPTPQALPADPDSELTLVQHRYELVADVGSVVRYDYVGFYG